MLNLSKGSVTLLILGVCTHAYPIRLIPGPKLRLVKDYIIINFQ